MLRMIGQRWSQVRYVARALGGFTVLINTVSVLVLLLAIAEPGDNRTRAAVLATVALFVGRVAYKFMNNHRRGRSGILWIGNSVVARVAITAGALAIGLTRDDDAWSIAAAATLLVLLIGEQTLRRPLGAATPQTANLPGGEVDLPSTRLSTWIFVIITTGIVLLSLAGAIGVTAAPAAVAGGSGVVLMIWVGVQSVRYLVQRRRLEQQLPSILEQLDPKFVFHWQAPAGTGYQASMWLPYLDRIGTPYFVLVRTLANFREVSKMTDAPVILRVNLVNLDPVITPSLRVVFYANTAVRNSHMIRFLRLTHIQLNHGDSDKLASVSPTFRQYDRNFVAGQAAIDRFALHGVTTRSDSFEIVGRPQLEDVRQSTGPISKVSVPVVLYSPTWSGFYDDSDYSSLRAGAAIVQGLLDRGCTVVFRPHPYARRHKENTQACETIINMLESHTQQTGTPHVHGATAETEMSVIDCFNASDAMISDVSSLVSDYLISGKPFAMAAVLVQGDAFVEEFPLARAAYVIDVVGGVPVDLLPILDDMLGPDPQADVRLSLRSYYLSDSPPAHIADRFLSTARRYLE